MPLYSKSQQQLLLDDFNAKNGSAVAPLTVDNAIFSTPKAIKQLLPTDPNTSVTVRARQGRGYAGETEITYTRLDLATLFKNQTPVLTLPNINVLSKGLANLNGRYGLNLTVDDIVDYNLYSGNKFTLRVKPACLQYVGSVTALYAPQRLVLDDLVVNPVIDCMKHPVRLDGRLCAKMVAWSYDFTDHAPLLTAMTAGSMSQGDNLAKGYSQNIVQLMMTMGFPQWDFTAAQWAVKTVASVKDANPLFDKVIVITNVNDSKIAGDIYLHYNG